MTKSKSTIAELLSLPELRDSPLIEKAGKIYVEMSKIRDIYVVAGIAMNTGDNEKALELLGPVHEFALELHESIHIMEERIALETKVAVERDRCNSRRRETLNWIEEES